MKKYIDKKNKFIELFNPKNGSYIRTGVIENNKDTGVDPFMRSFPFLLDIGIMNKCVCANKCNVDCYQNAINRHGENMSLNNYKKIMKQCKNKVGEVALGGAGDVDTHENFEEILKITNDYEIVPNFTTSGIMIDENKAKICKKYCGAVAVSQHSKLSKTILKNSDMKKNNETVYIENADNINQYIKEDWEICDNTLDKNYIYKTVLFEEKNYTYKAIQNLLNEGVKTNIHYVLSNKSINEAIYRLKYNAFPKGINAVIFLLYKPIGLGTNENVLQFNDKRLATFFELVDELSFPFKIGFDSCTVPAIINFTKNIDYTSLDSCEGGRYSAYITPDMKLLPCSFDNQDEKWAVDLNKYSIQEAWDSDVFNDFRSHFSNSCTNCEDHLSCYGGCPISRKIVLCNNKNKKLK